MVALSLDKKTVKLFVILLVATVLISAVSAVFIHYYFGHEKNGYSTDFNSTLQVGSKVTLGELVKDQNYDYRWISSDKVDIRIYVYHEGIGYAEEDGILSYDKDTRTFSVNGVSQGKLEFTSTVDSTVKYVMPYQTIFKNYAVWNMVEKECASSAFVKEKVVTLADMATITSLSYPYYGEADFSDLRFFENLETLYLTNESELVQITGDSLPEGINVRVAPILLERYMESYKDSDYYSAIHADTGSKVSIALDTNGGTMSAMDKNYHAVDKGSTVPVSTQFAIARTGYIFQGWFVEGTETAVNDAYVFNADTTIEARWEPISYNITLNYLDGESGHKDISLKYDEVKKLLEDSESLPVLEGYILRGWSYAANDTSAEFAIREEVRNLTTADGSTVELYAVWEKAQYDIRFYDGDDVIYTISDVPAGEQVTLKVSDAAYAALMDRPFRGWSSTHSAVMVDYEYESTVENGFFVTPAVGNIDLYASFNIAQFKIVFDLKGAPGSLDNQLCDRGVPYDLPSEITKRGYKFLGWKVVDGDDIEGFTDITVEPEAEIMTLYLEARWQINTFEVYLVSGTSTLAHGTAIYGEGLSLSATRTGKNLSAEKDGNSIGSYNYSTKRFAFTSSEILMLYDSLNDSGDQHFDDKSISLQARWSAITVKIYLENCNTTSIERSFGQSYNLPQPKAGNGDFKGEWKIKGTETTVTSSSSVSLDTAHTLVPKYDPKCLEEGTMVKMADGTEIPIQDVCLGDEVMVYDHFNGTLTTSPVIVISDEGLSRMDVLSLVFDDGTILSILTEHGVFDKTTNRYEQINYDNVSDFIGHEFWCLNDECDLETKYLMSYVIETKETRSYSMATAVHMNCICQGLFTVTDGIPGTYNFFEYADEMRYDPDDMEACIAEYGLMDYSDWSGYLSEEEFYAFNAQYVGISIGKGEVTFEDLVFLIEKFLRSGSYEYEGQ